MNADTLTVTPDWLLHVPIAKSVEDEDGRLWVEGIASDESVDLENEIVKASGLVDSLDLLEERGVFNWDHGQTIVGRPTVCELIDVEEARRRFPELREWFGRDFVGDRVFYIRGYIDAPAEGEPVSPDLLNARHALLHGHPLGFSLQGGRVKRGEAGGPDGRIYPATEQAVITAVALTPCPINQNSVARLAKSLSAAMQQACEDGEPVVVVAKSLVAGAGTDSAAMTGGRALMPESLLGATQDTLWTCPLCAVQKGGDDTRQDVAPRCPVCGGEMVRVVVSGRRRPVKKGLSALRRIARNLQATEGQTMSAILEKGLSHLKSALSILNKAAEIEDEEDEAKDEQQQEQAVQPVEDREEEQAPPSDAKLDEILDQIDEMDEGLPDTEAEKKDEDEEQEEDEDEFSKSVENALREHESLGPLLQADEAFGAVLDAFARAIAQRLDAQDRMLSGLAKAVSAQARLQAEQLAAERERQQAIGAMPAGMRIHKSAYDGDAQELVGELNDRITKSLHSGALSSQESILLRKKLQYGQVEEVRRELARLEQ